MIVLKQFIFSTIFNFKRTVKNQQVVWLKMQPNQWRKNINTRKPIFKRVTNMHKTPLNRIYFKYNIYKVYKPKTRIVNVIRSSYIVQSPFVVVRPTALYASDDYKRG